MRVRQKKIKTSKLLAESVALHLPSFAGMYRFDLDIVFVVVVVVAFETLVRI